MLILYEAENDKLSKQTIAVPTYIRKTAIALKASYPNKKSDGYKRLSHIIDPEYNKFKKNKYNKKQENITNSDDNNPDKVVKIPATTVKQIGRELKTPYSLANNKTQNMIRSWANNAVQKERSKNKPVIPVKKTSKASKLKPMETPKPDTVKYGGGKLTLDHKSPITVNISESQVIMLSENVGNTIDLTDDIKRYMSLCQNADILNPNMSIEASNLHKKLMYLLTGDEEAHEDEEYRTGFGMLLSRIRPWIKRGAKFILDRSEWEWKCIIGDDEIKGDCWLAGYDVLYNDRIINKNCRFTFNNQEWVIPFEIKNGIILGELDYRPSSRFSSTGYYHDPETTKISKEAASIIRGKGLIPIIIDFGTYHENIYKLFGVFPEKFEEFKKSLEEEGENDFVTTVEN